MLWSRTSGRRTTAILVLTGIVAMAGVLVWQSSGRAEGGAQAASPTGLCTVYLRGDVCGLALHDRVGDIGNLIVHSGQVVQLNDQWIALADKDQTWWIPRTSVALIVSKP